MNVSAIRGVTLTMPKAAKIRRSDANVKRKLLILPPIAIGIAVLAFFIVGASLPLAGTAFASNESAGIAFFESKIRPVLAENCYECHSASAVAAGKLKGGLQLDTREGIRLGGDTGPAVVPSKPSESLIITALRHEKDLEMPPDNKLSKAQ